jgi:dTMP kinase
MEILANFVVFEGLDGSGTTTQIGVLERFFLQNRLSMPPFHITFEPTNGSIGKLLRSILKGEEALKAETMALLFAADRNEHIFGVGGIAERCELGELVVSDRYLFSSLVYQGITCGNELPASLNKSFPAPELLIFLDIEPETALGRIESRRARKEIYENLDFQKEAEARYKTLLPEFASRGVRVETIDASLPPDEVARQVWAAIEKMPIFKR